MTELRYTAPEDVGLNAAQLERTQAHIAGYVERGQLPCGLLLVARQGAIAHVGATGLMDRARSLAVSADTIFRIYSMTKPVTCLALLMLYEEGRVQLDDPVAKYLPAFAGIRVYKSGAQGAFETTPPERAMTLRDLMSHQAGLTYGIQNRTPVDAAYRALKIDLCAMPREQWIETVVSVPLEFSPGSAWNYSIATDVLGLVIETIADQPLADVFRTRIFQPLGMRDTDFWVPTEKMDRLSACYQRGPDGGLVLIDDPQKSPVLKRPVFNSGGAGLLSTVFDYFRFAQMLAQAGRGEGHRLIGRKTFDLMTSNHLPGGADMAAHAVGLFSETTLAGMGFGLGVSVMLDPAKAQVPGTPGEFAWGGAASTYFWVDPKEELVVIFLTQLMPSWSYNIRRELRTMVYAALE